MHIAVSKGAQENQSFVFYVNYLSENQYIPRDSATWVDHIRQKGNEANHEIIIGSETDALDLLNFSEMLLKIMFEFPGRIGR